MKKCIFLVTGSRKWTMKAVGTLSDFIGNLKEMLIWYNLHIYISHTMVCKGLNRLICQVVDVILDEIVFFSFEISR